LALDSCKNYNCRIALLANVAVILLRQFGALGAVGVFPAIDMGVAPRFAYSAVTDASPPDQPERKNEQPDS
jgi:hypothetical protein